MGTAPDGVGAGMLLIGVRLAAGGFPRSLCSCFGSRHLRQLAHQQIARLHRNAKAAFAAFSDREMPQLKLDRPGLKQSQY